MVALLMASMMCLQAQEFIPLWPEGGMPNSRGTVQTDSISNERIHRVGVPGIYVFRTSDQENSGSAVVIFPGGGYTRLAYVVSGFQLAKWFNTMGMNAFVVKYRLPQSPDVITPHEVPFQDAQRAMRLVRSKAMEWGILAHRIGAMGISAGGHVAAGLATLQDDLARIGDTLDGLAIKPDFLLLLSPVITMKEYTHAGSRRNLLGNEPEEKRIEQFSMEMHVGKQNPPTFLVHAFDDKSVPVKNSLAFYDALVSAGIPSSLHVFPFGGHSIALRGNPGSTASWTMLCEDWLKEMGFLLLPQKK